MKPPDSQSLEEGGAQADDAQDPGRAEAGSARDSERSPGRAPPAAERLGRADCEAAAQWRGADSRAGEPAAALVSPLGLTAGRQATMARDVVSAYYGLFLSHRKGRIPICFEWMELEGIMPSEVSQSEKGDHHVVSLIRGI